MKKGNKKEEPPKAKPPAPQSPSKALVPVK